MWAPVGHSVLGRPIVAAHVGGGSRTVVWVGGIHGDEPEGTDATVGVAEAVQQDASLAAQITLLVVQDVNPDGRATHTRTNANGVDLNRNFPAANFDSSNPAYGRVPLSQPESRALHDLIVGQRPDLVVVCHAWRGASFINYDGPARAQAAALAGPTGWPVKPSGQLGESTPGSLGAWVGGDLGTPIVTIEWRRGSDPSADWAAVRVGVMKMLAEAYPVGGRSAFH